MEEKKIEKTEKSLQEKLYDIIDSQLTTNLGKLVSTIIVQEPDYKEDWCNKDSQSELFINLIECKGKYVKSIVDNLLAYNKEENVQTINKETNKDDKFRDFKDITKEVVDNCDYIEVKKEYDRNHILILTDGRYFAIQKQPKDYRLVDRLIQSIKAIYPDLQKFKE